MTPPGAYATDTHERKRDVLDYIDWVWFLCEIEAHRMDPLVEWQRDMSYAEIEYARDVGAPPIEMPHVGERASTELGTVQLYWPGSPPV